LSINEKLKEVGSSHEQQDLAIKSILDLFPDYEIDLIKKCLKYFNNNIEEVINAFLENNIPEFPSDSNPATTKTTAASNLDLDYDNDQYEYEELNLRRNVYDGDDFDVFRKDNIDKSKIVLGKK